jgi:hypothetical protein
VLEVVKSLLELVNNVINRVMDTSTLSFLTKNAILIKA